MRFPVLALLLLVAAISVTDAGLIKLIARGVKIAVKAIIGATTGGGTATVVTTAVLTATDLALNLGNVISGGCMYEPEICNLKPEIENLQKQIEPKYKELERLDSINNNMYNELVKNLNKNNKLATKADKVQFLVVSIIQKLGDPQKIDRVAQDVAYNSQKLVDAFKVDIEKYQSSMDAKAITSGIADGTVLLYYGTKYAYDSLKAAGKIKTPTAFKTAITTIKAKTIVLPKPKFLNSVSNTLSGAKTFFRKPTVAKFVKGVASGGMVLGAIVGLGLTLGVDISQAKQMRDSLRATRDELRVTLNDVTQELQKENTASRNLASSLNEIKTTYSKLVGVINPSLTRKINLGDLSRLSPSQLLSRQKEAIKTYTKVIADLEKMNQNFDVIKEVRYGVDGDSSVNRIISSLANRGLGSFSANQIYKIIAAQYPSLNNYQGHSLKG